MEIDKARGRGRWRTNLCVSEKERESERDGREEKARAVNTIPDYICIPNQKWAHSY